MATADDGATTYNTGGAGGKLRKRPIRRSSQTTPYDRPPTAVRNNSPTLLSKLVNPASKLIYAGADRLFSVFRKRIPSVSAPLLPGISEEPKNSSQEAVPNSALKNSTGVGEPSTNEGGNLASTSVATEISDLENMLKQKTFTRSEFERLTTLLLSRTTESNVVEVDKEKLPSTSYHVERPDAFTSGTLNKHVEDRDLDAAISTPVVHSRVFEDDGASPADLAKAYMGTRSTKLSPLTMRPSSQALRKDSVLLNNTTTFPKTPMTSLVPKTATATKASENSLTTLRSRGRSALYNMPRTPYYRGPSTLSQKGVASPSAWENEGSIGSNRMAAKRRSSALDDIGSGGPMRRIRQKANLLSQQSSFSKHKSELGSSQRLLLRNEIEPQGSKAVEETREFSKREQIYGSVPTESSRMALKIFEQLDRMSPKEKPSGSKLAGTSEKKDSPKILSSSQDTKKAEGQQRVLFPDAHGSTYQNKDRVQGNSSRNIVGHSNVLGTINGNFGVPVNGNAPIDAKASSTTTRAFLMSAHEDALELDDGNHSNGYASISLGENKKRGTSLLANNDASTGTRAEVIRTAGAISESKKGDSPSAVLEVDPIPRISESKKDAISSSGSVFNNQKTSFNFHASTLSSTTQLSVLSQQTSIVDSVTTPSKPAVFPTFGTSTSNSAGTFGFKPNISPDAKPLSSTGLINSTVNNDPIQSSAANKDDNGNTQKPVTLFGNSRPSSSANLTTTSASGISSVGGSTNNSGAINGTSSSSPSVLASSSSFQPSGTNTNKISSSSSSPVPSSATTSAASSTSSTSVPASLFKFGSATASSTSHSMAPAAPFSSTAFATSSNGGSISGLSSSSATLTTNGFQANTQAASTAGTQTVPHKFDYGSSGMPSSSSASSLFSSSAPSFGLTSAVTTSDIKSGGSTSSSTTNLFGSGFSSTPSFGLTSAVTSSEIKPGDSTSASTTNLSGSGVSSTPSFGLSSTVASSETKSGSLPFMFGSSSASAPMGSSTSTPSVSSSPFMFGSSNSTSTGSSTSVSAASSSPFMFGSSNASASMGSSTSTPASSSPFMFESSNASPLMGSSTSTPSASSSPFMFGSSNAGTSTGSATSMFSASSSPFMFGSSNAGASTGSSMFSFSSNTSSPAPVFGNSTPVFGTPPTNNNDNHMEDSMADDSNQAPSPSVPAFAQTRTGTPGFMFGSGTPTTPSAAPFQFGGQTNQPQPPSQNPFAASGGSSFNAGGSFSLGSGGDDKSNRRILRVKRQNRRK